LKLEVTTLITILDGGATITTTSGVVKWYGGIATHQNLTKTMREKTPWHQ
jgi:hypothetical protein